MAERRITDVMRQTGGLDEPGEDLDIRRLNLFAVVRQPGADLDAEAAPNAGDLQAVDQPVVDVVVVVEGMDLGLVGQPPERLREEDTVLVLAIDRPMFRRHVVGLA